MSPRARKPWGEAPPPDPHVWNTLRYRGVEQADGRAVIEWDAAPEYCFHSPSGPIVHGGMVAALLDTAMGGACWTLMAEDEDFLTADLRTEFHRSARPGTLRAEGRVVQRNRRVVFCAAELYQDGELVASARCTQIVRRNSSA
ncbi:MAG TPA: PaaI family thioesterase [Gaiellaceae bacterium]|nr:PaaI family thioesterase [Gaiellaceae bacterium]